MIVRDPYFEERRDPDTAVAGSLWVDLDKQRRFPFGFAKPVPAAKKKAKKPKGKK